MNIIVFIKQVPDTATRIKIAADGKSIDESDVTWIISPYDEFALEEALKIKEAKGAGKVTVISAGSERAATSLRNALAMGADDAVHLLDPAFIGSDAFAIAKIVAASVKNRPYDILFFGKMGVGMDQSQVPAMVAELLNLPLVTQIAKLEIQDGKAVVHREIEGATEHVDCSLPAALAAEKGLNEPRYPSLKGIMAAKKKPLEVLNAASLGLNPEEVGVQGSKVVLNSLSLPPGRQAGKILQGDPQEAVTQLVKMLHEEAKVI
ncbi:electron transfer flavoprotein subunit beta/FixA family protein [bacterium]|nr:electron transfer flavoprotein subunit beta/FixA family protein [bacterium]MCI0604067.1 electron transfer flavoprotein subunit beta/FixA family protein [bacterium]